jgi:signal transduction histidine kinase
MPLVTITNLLKRSPLASVLACVAALMLLVTSEGSYWRSAATLDRLDAMADVPAQVQALQWGVVDATAATPDPKAQRSARERVDVALAAIDAHYRLRPQAQAVLSALHERVTGLLAHHDPALAAGGVRTLGAELLQDEATEIARSRNDLDRSLRAGRIGVACLGAVGLLAWAVSLRRSRRLGRQQQVSQGHLRAERDRLGVEAVDRTAQLTELTRHLQTAREDERSRLARDLHDELGALLTSAKLDAARMRSRLAGTAPEALERLAHLVSMLDRGIALKRRIVEDLRPSSLDTLGLAVTLEILAREFAEQSGVVVHRALEPVTMTPAAALVAYRLVQEAVTNITKYAKATQIWITLAARDGLVDVSVRDDGVGFDPDAALHSSYGLVGMRYRVEAENGTLTVRSAPGQGTLIRMTLPRPVAHA